MSKFTPGPWTYYNEYLCSAREDGSIPINSRIVMSVPDDLGEADARLIAAAPKLYAALARVVTRLPYHTLADKAEIAEVNALLSSIEGESK